ncbi:MAG: hypothetical protein ABR571_09725 [Jatrophihabitans sp.]|uniref:hypothetical protein n=1 Tax=Jatrophihabitans sp. TaxID=1932789 RepID=UPI003910C4D0
MALGALTWYLGSRPDRSAPPAHQALPPPVQLTQPRVSVPPTRPGPPHDLVAPAAPTAFTLTGPRFTIKAHVCAMTNIRPYDPPGEQHHTICWVRGGFGVAPSSEQPATSYLFGHSWAPDAQEVLNKASTVATAELLHAHPAMRNGVPVYPVHALDGYRLVLRTRTGTLIYRVRDVYGVRKNQLGFIRSWLDPTRPGRVVLTTCAERGGVDYDYNVVIEAYLAASARV